MSRHDEGAVATEYALLAAAIALVIALSVGIVGENVLTLFNSALGIFE